MDKFPNQNPKQESHEEIKLKTVFRSVSKNENLPESNQDAVVVGDDIVSVLDGVGGGPAGRSASLIAKDSILANSKEMPNM